MRNYRTTIGIATIAASVLHITSDVLEWSDSGFSHKQLIINYIAFLMMPFCMLGLYAVQTPKIGWKGLAGAVLYSVAFVYFAHTTLLSIEETLPDYETLWRKLGWVYTLHGAFMIVGGAIFVGASAPAGILSKRWLGVFLAGLSINLLVALLPLPDIFQTIGSYIRNLGLVGLGTGLLITGDEKSDS